MKRSLVLLAALTAGILGLGWTATPVIAEEDIGGVKIIRLKEPARLPLIEGEDLTTGKDFSLEQLAGQVVVLDLWATWCGPCVKEMPDLVKFQTANKDKKFSFVGIHADPDVKTDSVKKLSKKLKVNYPVVMGTKPLMGILGKALDTSIPGIPFKIFLNREGKAVAWMIGSPKDLLDKKEKERVEKEYDALIHELIETPVPAKAGNA